MSILFSEIYSKAIALFDDPKITVAYETDKIQYEKLMYSFLQNAIGMFHNPSAIAVKLSSYTSPSGIMEVFEGDGETNTFELSEEFEIIEGAKYSFIQGNKKVQAKLEQVTKQVAPEPNEDGTVNLNLILKKVYQVTFPDVLPKGQQYAIEQYYCGHFDAKFNDLNKNAPQKAGMIENLVKEILARLVVQAWAESQRNDYVDVNNILTDTDFKNHPAYNMLKANNSFVRQLTMEINELENRLAWIIRFGKTNSYIGRG